VRAELRADVAAPRADTAFGRVPDCEMLRLLAHVTGGQFVRADDFPEVPNLPAAASDELQDLSRTSPPQSPTAPSPGRGPRAPLARPKSVRRVGASSVAPPNWFHRLVLVRSMVFAPVGVGSRYDHVDVLGRPRQSDRPVEVLAMPSTSLTNLAIK
jgi:hypothetical protein